MKTYAEKNLIPGEKIVYAGHRHWIVFMAPVIWLLLGVIFVVELNVWLFAMLAWIIAAFYAVLAWIDYVMSEIIVTNMRILIKVGWLSRDSIETTIANISSISVRQTILGRFLNYGSITVSDRGSARAPFLRIQRPFKFRQAVQEQQERASKK
ncbi:MAG: PH domain-containing protein [Pseudomonadota bacterium]